MIKFYRLENVSERECKRTWSIQCLSPEKGSIGKCYVWENIAFDENAQRGTWQGKNKRV